MNKASLLSLLVLLATLFFSATASDKIEVEDPDVIIGTSDNFDSVLAENDIVLVEYYQHWCGHCKRLAPEFAEAATSLKGKAALMKIDCGEEEDVCSQAGVRGYPSLKMVTDGVTTDFKGGRTADEIVAYVEKFSGPAFQALSTAEELEAAIEAAETPVVFFTGSGKDQKKFVKLANKMRIDFTFIEVSEAAAEAVNFPEGSTLVLRKVGEEDLPFSGKFKVSKVTKFLEANELALLGELGPNNYSKYRGVGKPLVYVFVDPNDEDTKAFVELMTPVAGEFKEDLVMATVDGIQYKSQAERLGLVCDDLPCLAIQDAEDRHFAYNEDADQTAVALTKWFKEFVSGDMLPTVKSEDIPEEQGTVLKVVGNNFEEIAYGEKDALISLTAPWCGHCKALHPVFEELGELIEDSENIVIGNFDATANDLPTGEKGASGYPTIRFYKAGSSEGVTYEGDRDVAGFLAYLKENSVNAAEIEDVEE